MTRRRWLTALAGLLALTAATTATVAAARTPSQSAPACVTVAAPVGSPGADATPPIRCFASVAAAMRAIGQDPNAFVPTRSGTLHAPATQSSPGPPGNPAPGTNCVAEAVPAGAPESSAPPVRCYPTFAQAIAAATGGRVRLPANAGPGSLARVRSIPTSGADVPR